MLVRTICLAEFEPAATLPKLRLVGLALIWPTAATPVPLTEMDSGEFEASLVRVILPLALPALVGANVTVRVAVCEAFNVAGTVKPLTVNPEPLALTAETWTAALPELVITICLAELEPVVTLPKLRLVGFGVSWPVGATAPVPLSETVSGEPVASLVIVRLPVRLPVVVGANLMVSVADWDALKVAGTLSPLTLKPLPEALTAEMCTSVLPVLVMTTCFEELDPEVTLPKLRLVGFALSVPEVATPIPERVKESVEFEASLVTVMPPVALPALVGANVTVRVAVWEGFTVAGTVMPLTLKPLPLVVMAEMWTAALPVFVITICLAELEPVFTFPKLRLIGFALSCPVAVADPVPERGMLRVWLAGSLLVIARLPVDAPVVFGLYVRVTAADWPAGIVLGVEMPETPKSAPVSVRTEMVKSAAPLLEIVRLEEP